MFYNFFFFKLKKFLKIKFNIALNFYIKLTKKYKALFYLNKFLLILSTPLFIIFKILIKIINFIKIALDLLDDIIIYFFKKIIKKYNNIKKKTIPKPIKNFFYKYIINPIKNFFYKYIINPIKNLLNKHVINPTKDFFNEHVLEFLKNESPRKFIILSTILNILNPYQIKNNIKKISLYIFKWSEKSNISYDFYKKLYMENFDGSWKKFLENRKKPLENFTWLEFFNTDNWIPFIKHTCKLVEEYLKKDNLGFYDKNKKLSYTHVYIIIPFYFTTSMKTLSDWYLYLHDPTLLLIICIILLTYFLSALAYAVYIHKLVKEHNFDINKSDLIFLITWLNIWCLLFISFILFKLVKLGYFKTICLFLWHLFFNI